MGFKNWPRAKASGSDRAWALAAASVFPCFAQKNEAHPPENQDAWHDFHSAQNQNHPQEFHPGHAGDWLIKLLLIAVILGLLH